MDECKECGAPTTIVDTVTFTAAGPGPRGATSIVVLGRILCAAGHRYDEIIDSIEEES